MCWADPLPGFPESVGVAGSGFVDPALNGALTLSWDDGFEGGSYVFQSGDSFLAVVSSGGTAWSLTGVDSLAEAGDWLDVNSGSFSWDGSGAIPGDAFGSLALTNDSDGSASSFGGVIAVSPTGGGGVPEPGVPFLLGSPLAAALLKRRR
jgi:hypothetical protein